MREPAEISETAQLNTVVDWSRNPRTRHSVEKQVYKHVLRREEENQKGKVYKYFSYGNVVSKKEFEKAQKKGATGTYACYYCDLVYYLDIYWQ